MKKLLCVILALVLSLTVFACAKPEESSSVPQRDPRNEIERLVFEGYDFNGISMSQMEADEGTFATVLVKGEKLDHVYLANASLTPEEYETLSDAMFPESGEQDEEYFHDLIFQLKNVTIKDFGDQFPDQPEIDSWNGKTIGELEDAGFNACGNMNFNGVISLNMEGPVWAGQAEVTIQNASDDFSIDELSDEERRALVIKKMTFTGISMYLVDYVEEAAE